MTDYIDYTHIMPRDMEICTTTNFRGGEYEIECKLGLWGVYGADYNKLITEASHYFQQYRSDGEYAELLGDYIKQRGKH